MHLTIRKYVYHASPKATILKKFLKVCVRSHHISAHHGAHVTATCLLLIVVLLILLQLCQNS